MTTAMIIAIVIVVIIADVFNPGGEA